MQEPDVDIERLFEKGNEPALDTYLNLLHPADIAELFEHVDPDNWTRITVRLSPEILAEVLTNLDESQLEILGEALNTARLIEVVDELETDDAADVLADLPDEKSAVVLPELEDRDDIETLLAYPDDSAGGIMQTEVSSVESDKTVGDAIAAVRIARELVDEVLDTYVVDKQGRLQGIVSLQDIVVAQRSAPISSIRSDLEVFVTVGVDQEEVAQLFMKYDVPAMPVVDESGVLVGRITYDDVHDVLQEEASEDILTMAGASAEELVYEGSVLRIVALRLPWLISSLLGSLVTTQLVPLFSRVPMDTIVLASFVPVVMAMTGNVGSQSAMIITRGFAIGRVELATIGRTFGRELWVGLLMGVAAAVVVGLFAQYDQGDPTLGLALGLSMVVAMTTATLVGVAAPALFKKLGIDPAIAAGPLVTTGCDVLGVGAYLAVALVVIS